MTNFLTRLLERTQGTIPSSQLAQPLLNSTFAPISRNVESIEPSIEVYEERETSPDTSHLLQHPAQESSYAKRESFPHSSSQTTPPEVQSVERQAAESFELPAELPSHLTDNSPQHLSRQQQFVQASQREPYELNEAHQETLHESVEVSMDVQPNQPPSYSQKGTVLSSPTPLTLQADFAQASQQNIFTEQQDIPQIHERATGIEESREGSLNVQELLVEARQATLSAQQPKALILSTSGDMREESAESGEIGKSGEREESGVSSTFTELVKSTFIENEAREPYGQTHEFANSQLVGDLLLPQQTLNQDVVRVSAQQDVVLAGPIAPMRMLESQGELLIAPQRNSMLRVASLTSPLTSSTPALSEQERIDDVESVDYLWDDVTRELGKLEEVGRVQREVSREEQGRVVELIQQEQARQNDVSTPRRIIPSQLPVTRQEQAKEPDQSIQSSVTLNTLPTINVSIGRIEVRAVTAPMPVARLKPVRPSPALSLEEYLKQQSGGR